MNHRVKVWICYNKYSSYPINWFWHWLHDMWRMQYMYVHCFNFSLLCLPWYFKEELSWCAVGEWLELCEMFLPAVCRHWVKNLYM